MLKTLFFQLISRHGVGLLVITMYVLISDVKNGYLVKQLDTNIFQDNHGHKLLSFSKNATTKPHAMFA